MSDNVPTDSTFCNYCGLNHPNLWTEIFLKVIRCEKFQKTAEYVSELLEPYGKTLSDDGHEQFEATRRWVEDGFTIGSEGKLRVLKIIRWWLYHYYWTRERGLDVCLDELTHNILVSSKPTESYDKTRIFVTDDSFYKLITYYERWTKDYLWGRRALSVLEWVPIPAGNVIERNLPLLFDKRTRCVHVLPVELRYDTVKQGWP